MTQAKRITLISAFVLLVAFGTYVLAARSFSPEKDVASAVPASENITQVEAAASTPQPSSQKVNTQVQERQQDGTKSQIASSVSSSATRNCTAADLEGKTAFQSIGSTVVGIFTLTARDKVSCTLAGYPLVSVVDNRGTLSGTTYFLSAGPNVLLKAGESATSRVIWSNWCGRATSDLSLRVSLSGDKGYLLIPAINAAGKAQSMAPSCIDDHASSTVSVTGFAK